LHGYGEKSLTQQPPAASSSKIFELNFLDLDKF